MLKRWKRVVQTGAILCAVVLLQTGCMRKSVTISSDPPRARIYLNGVYHGLSPLQKDLSFSEVDSYVAKAKKDGFDDALATIKYYPREKKHYLLTLEKSATIEVELISLAPVTTGQSVTLSVTTKPTLAYLEVIERSPNAVSVTLVTHNEDPALQINDAILSPIDDTLVYAVIVKEESGSKYSNVWKQSVGSSARTRVTFGKWMDYTPCFSSDGSKLLFSSTRVSENPTLWRINVNGRGGITRITNTAAADAFPTVSAQSERIVYASLPPAANQSQIWSVRSDGSLPTQLREGDQPCLSPDGRKILFCREDDASEMDQIWVMGMDGSEETQLTQNINYRVSHPRWSPDGRWIVYASDEGLDSKKLQNFDIWVMDADGSNRAQLTTNGSWDDMPCWDASGENIYFRSNRGGVWNIWRFSPVLPQNTPVPTDAEDE